MRKLRLLARTGCATLGLVAMAVLPAAADPIVVSSDTATAMVNALLSGSSGITVVGTPTYTGAAGAAGVFTGASGILPFNSGVALTTGSAAVVPMPIGSTNPNHCPNAGIPGPNNCISSGINNGQPGSASLSALTGKTTFDAASLMFSFIPIGNQLSLQYVFGSEEYTEFVGSTSLNDAFAIYLNGVNIAFVPGTSTPINATTVNGNSHSQYFTSNTDGSRNIQYDGLVGVNSSFPLTATGSVNPNQVNTIQLVIADVGVAYYDSGLMLGGMFTNGESVSWVPTPEPGTFVLMGSGALVLVRRLRNRRTRVS
jgi:hypothetical protein